MAGETPDYQRLNVQSTVFPMTDLGELAVRLGSIVTFDRRGDVVLVEDFEAGLGRWKLQLGGTGAVVDLSRTGPRSGQLSCRLVKASDGSKDAGIEHVFPLTALSPVGAEVSFAELGGAAELHLRIDYADGTRAWRFELVYREAQEDIQVLQADGTYETIATGLPVFAETHGHSTIKLVADLAQLGYVRALFNSITVDVSSFAPQDVAALALVQMAVGVRNEGALAASRTVYVDDVIVTQNEPP